MNADKTIGKAVSLIEQASKKGAKIVAFPEVFIPGYPWWICLGNLPWGHKFIVPYHENSLQLRDVRMAKLQEAAKRHSIAVIMGYSERDGASRYMSQVFIDADGTIVGNRRKLKPTSAERMIYGEGDGSDFFVHDFEFGRVGALNCWEHFQPLSKMAMYSLHEQIHVASWPSMLVDEPGAKQSSASVNASLTVTCSYALEGSCFVLCATQVYGKAAVDAFCDTEDKKHLFALGGGFARIFGPGGATLVDPLSHDEEGIVCADIDLAEILEAKASADPVGHYSRGDALSLLINRNGRAPVRLLDENDRLELPLRYFPRSAPTNGQTSIPLAETSEGSRAGEKP
ncbi:aliphatic nitrilase [Aminobacter aganoensis]|uniref:Aliphatic nitrilase n=1 Tax=Aminobacter aganoensis TaxID=83264 RepID=A0A7X0KNK1_9HYPH|nr:aliphatic nitrilase [Aminobacter aganoensis]UKS89417.1 nitrilase [synthetic construct]